MTALHAEYRRAHDQGWLRHFVEAARAFELRPEILMGIASRETNMGGRELAPGEFEWLTRPGDGGHGYGLMQIDGRSYPGWVAMRGWILAEDGIHYGAEVLADKRDGLIRRAGLLVSVRERGTQNIYRFTMPAFAGPVIERVAIAAYNCGDWAAYHASKGRDVDRGTTGGNYSSDVLSRASQFRIWLTADGWLVPPVPAA